MRSSSRAAVGRALAVALLGAALIAAALIAVLGRASSGLAAPTGAVIVGSKTFTEGVVLGELIRAMVASTGTATDWYS